MMFPHKLVATPKASHDMAAATRTPKAFAQPSRIINQLPLQHGMRVADFGAGAGAYTFAMAENVGPAGHVYAIDVQQDLLSKIKNTAIRDNHKNIDIVWGDIEKKEGSKLGSASVDMVLVSNTLFQAEHKKNLLQEAKRVLKPGGTLAIIDWAEKGESGKFGPHGAHLVTKETASALASGAGFAYAREFDAGSHHYGLIYKRPMA